LRSKRKLQNLCLQFAHWYKLAPTTDKSAYPQCEPWRAPTGRSSRRVSRQRGQRA